MKKSQVTIFLILGILILAGGAAYLFLEHKRVYDLRKGELPVYTEDVPVEHQPVRAYVEDCLIDTAVAGLKKLGEQGGYIYPESYGLKAAIEPTQGDLVRFSPYSELTVAYWWYLKSDNLCSGDCSFKIGKPNLYREQGEPSIEGQLDRYVDENLEKCLGNFEVFRNKGYSIRVLEKPKTKTTITVNDVLFELKFPVESVSGQKQIIKEYYIKIPLNLKRIYEQATLLTNLQAEFKYLERDVLDLITGFSDVDPDKLPPMSELRFELKDRVTWKKSEIKANIQNMLASYLQLLKVYGSQNYIPYLVERDTLEDSLYNSMVVVSEEISPELAVNYNYLTFWPVHFNLNCKGELCQPESVSNSFIPIIGLHKYNFVYDISFPVLVELNDPNALNRDGYNFQFFLEGNIRNNKPLNSSFADFSFTITRETMLCDNDKRNSGEISINVSDNEGNVLDDVQVAYTCADQGCSIGATVNGVLKEKFPICLGGVVSFINEGFITTSRILTTQLDKTSEIKVVMQPIKAVPVELKKFKLTKSGGSWSIAEAPIELDDDEEAVISLDRIENINDADLTRAAMFKPGEPSEIEIAPGRYSIDITVMKKKSLVVPEDKRKEGTWPFEKEYTIPKLEINNSYISGGLRLNYTFPNPKKITFYVVSPDYSSVPKLVVEDLEQMNMIEEYSRKYSAQLKPKLE